MATHANSTAAPQAPFYEQLARSRRAALEAWVSAAIDLLDDIDGDLDGEPDTDSEDGHDAEQDPAEHGIGDAGGLAEQDGAWQGCY